MPTPIIRARVTPDGKLVVWDSERALWRAELRRLAGKDVDLTVKAHRERRSVDQNAWWWAVCVPLIAAELGYDKHERADVHYALVAKCFGTHFDEKLGQEMPNARSSQLTTAQFSELMEWAVRWAAVEHGIVVPLPGEAAA